MRLSIVQARKNRRLTQEQVATALGVSVPTYRKIETDPSKIAIEKALRLAEVFGVKFEDLELYSPPLAKVQK